MSLFVLNKCKVRFNVMQYAVPDVKEVFNWLEVDFHPLKLCGRVTKVIIAHDFPIVHLNFQIISESVRGAPHFMQLNVYPSIFADCGRLN